MIIRELNIVGFGKHSDTKIELSDGINIIYGENESGKSTVAAFVHAMMYGVEKKRGKPAPDSIYGRYQPVKEQWSGSMKFEYEGRIYEIFRSFPDAKKPVVMDLATGLSVDYEDIKEAFGEEKIFDATLYLPQDKNDDGAKIFDSISAYTESMSMGRDEHLDVSGAKKKLKNKIKELEQAKSDKKEELRALTEKCERLRQATADYDKEAERLGGLREQLVATNPQKEEKVKSLKAYINQLPEIELKYERLCQNKKQVQLITQMEEEKNEGKSSVNMRAKAAYYCLLLGVLLLGVTGTLLLPVSPVVKVLLIVALVLVEGVVSFLWDNVIIRRFAGRFIENETNASVQESERCRKLIEECEELKRSIEEYARGSVNSFGVNDEGMESLRYGVEKLRESVDKYYEMENERVTGLSREIDRQEWMLEDISHKMQGENYETVLDTLEKCRGDISFLDKKIKAANTAKELIDKISKELGGGFKAEIIKDFSENVAAFTIGEYERVLLDDNMGIKLLGKNGFTDIAKLSYGTVKQVYLALRLAVAKWLGQENMPMVIDDGFAFFDDQRLKETLIGISKQLKGQVIVFTCHKREEQVLLELGLAYNSIKM